MSTSTTSDLRFHLPEINTWRLYNKAVDQTKVQSMVEAWEAHGYRFGTICIDDGWTIDAKLGDWTPDPRRFPDFKAMADWIHAKGYALRLWVAPIQINPGTEIYHRAFPHSVLKNKHGEPAFYAGPGTYRLDPRTELAQEHIRQTLQRLVRDYQADAFKVDFPPFYVAHDDFYEAAGFDFPEHDNATMVPNFYRLVRESLDEINPAVRVECAKDLAGCEDYVNDIICGDLVGDARSMEHLSKVLTRLKNYAQGRPLIPWLEMIWGEGGPHPNSGVEWYAGCLEYIALSINFNAKLEHSFFPFDYPNHNQIRALTNLYGPRLRDYKVLHAGRKSLPVGEMLKAGIELTPRTRFLVAPEDDVTVYLHTAMLRTNALYWRCRDVETDQEVKLRGRNEFWSNRLESCYASFEARRHRVYEMWYEGEEDTYFPNLFAEKVAPLSAP